MVTSLNVVGARVVLESAGTSFQLSSILPVTFFMSVAKLIPSPSTAALSSAPYLTVLEWATVNHSMSLQRESSDSELVLCFFLARVAAWEVAAALHFIANLDGGLYT